MVSEPRTATASTPAASLVDIPIFLRIELLLLAVIDSDVTF
jgi:hypothetical protein